MRSSSIKSLVTAASLALTVAAVAPTVQAAPQRATHSQATEIARGGDRDFDFAGIVKRFLKRFGVRTTETPLPPYPGAR